MQGAEGGERFLVEAAGHSKRETLK